jgi:hypothetical protein
LESWSVADSSPIVVRVSTGLKAVGDCVNGSGDVPHEELAPIFELEDADGELVVVAGCESKLVREPLLLGMSGLNILAPMLARSSFIWESRPIWL